MVSDAAPNGSSAVTTDMMQVINYEEEFNTDLGAFLERNNIANLGFDYNVTAIMGPQSSGKSTLLNLLFGTEFRTMDALQGRYQVTQGVWLGRDDARGIVVMDLEGTDSRERGEDAASFERKSSLFALALAEVLIVNVWTQDVGRFNAANLSLLKTVMELDLQLFFSGDVRVGDGSPKRQGHKTRLLFVLRDHVATPLEALTETLTTDVNNIWNSISKPEAALNTAVTDYFDLTFFALPHKVLMADDFAKEAARLRMEFMEGDMFLDEYRREVAADGFATYAESVWSTIRDNKELDIPSQKEMLATVRCEQIARDVIEVFEKKLTPLKTGLESSTETTPDLFKKLMTLCDDTVKVYDEGAFRYAKSVATQKGQDLREKIGNDCRVLFEAQVAIASDNALKGFEERLSNRKQSSKRNSGVAPWEQWGTVSLKAKDAVLETFDTACSTEPVDQSGHPLAFAESTSSNARKRLIVSLDSELARATEDTTVKAREFCLKTFDSEFKPNLAMVLDKPDEDVWDRTSEVAAQTWEKTQKNSVSVFGTDGLGLEGEALEEAVEDQLKPECLERSMKSIRDTVGSPSSFVHRMTKRFDDLFRFDESGVPRSFGPDEDLKALYVEARGEAEKLADLFAEIKLTGPLTVLRQATRDVASSTPHRIFEAHQKTDLRNELHRRAGAVFMEARRSQEAAKITTRVPVWIFALLIVLGWNEIIAILRSPILLFLCLLLGPMLYLFYSTGNATVLVPAIRAMVGPLMHEAQTYFDLMGAPPIAGPPPPTNGTTVERANGHEDNEPRDKSE